MTRGTTGIWTGLLLALCGCTAMDNATGGNQPDPVVAAITESFDQDIDAVLAKMDVAEPDHDLTYKGTLISREGANAGMVVLSTCGCGYWRAYVEADSQRLLVKLQFADFPDSFSRFSTPEGEPVDIVGQFHAAGELAFGQLASSASMTRFDAIRDVAAGPTAGCILCHVGDEPPLPLPSFHRPVTKETNCLGCHSTDPH